MPWFEDSICYYTETANSKQVFDFLYQPPLLDYQTNGLDPLALQEPDCHRETPVTTVCWTGGTVCSPSVTRNRWRS